MKGRFTIDYTCLCCSWEMTLDFRRDVSFGSMQDCKECGKMRRMLIVRQLIYQTVRLLVEFSADVTPVLYMQKDMEYVEVNGRRIFEGTVPEFTWKSRGKSQDSRDVFNMKREFYTTPHRNVRLPIV
jgi:hypothetical protein